MLNKTKISAVLLTLCLATSATLHAEEVSLENEVAQLLSQSVASTQQELSYDIQSAMQTWVNQISNSEEGTYATKTNITDLDSHIGKAVKHETEE